MAKIRKKEESKSFAEESSNLWLITFAALIWAVHFVVCYAASAIVCAKYPNEPNVFWYLRLALMAASAAALAGIGYVGWRSWDQWDFLEDYDYKHDKAVAEHRHEFLGHASFLLSCVSFVAVVYVSLPLVFMETCR